MGFGSSGISYGSQINSNPIISAVVFNAPHGFGSNHSKSSVGQLSNLELQLSIGTERLDYHSEHDIEQEHTQSAGARRRMQWVSDRN